MALEEVGAWLDDGLVLPIAGKKYRVPPPSAELGIRLELLLVAANRESDRYQQLLSDQEERDLYADLLGEAYDQLLDDGISFPVLKLAAVTAWHHFVLSPEAGEKTWNEGAGSGKAVTQDRSPRPATRRTTGAASTTKPQASGSGTRSRPRS